MDDCVMVNAEGLVPETMTGTISSLIAGSPKNSGKIVILRTDGSEGTIKFSSRKSASCKKFYKPQSTHARRCRTIQWNWRRSRSGCRSKNN